MRQVPPAFPAGSLSRLDRWLFACCPGLPNPELMPGRDLAAAECKAPVQPAPSFPSGTPFTHTSLPSFSKERLSN